MTDSELQASKLVSSPSIHQEVKRATTDQGQKKIFKKKKGCGIHQCAWLCIVYFYDPQPPTLFKSWTFKNIAAANVDV